MSIRSIDAVLGSRAISGVYRLAMLAIADGGGEASIESVCRWVNCDEGSAASLLDDMANIGLVEEIHDDDQCTIRYFSEWLYSLTYGTAPTLKERSRYIPKSVRDEVFEECGWSCSYCGAEGVDLQIDHVIPHSRGGSNDKSNLTAACAPCNNSKRAKTPEEWVGRQ